MPNPVGRIRNRIGRAIDWRVESALATRSSENDAAVQHALDRHGREVSHASTGDLAALDAKVQRFENGRLIDRHGDRVMFVDAMKELDRRLAYETKDDRLAVEALRSLFRSAAIDIAEQHRTSAELMERLDQRLKYLESRPVLSPVTAKQPKISNTQVS